MWTQCELHNASKRVEATTYILLAHPQGMRCTWYTSFYGTNTILDCSRTFWLPSRWQNNKTIKSWWHWFITMWYMLFLPWARFMNSNLYRNQDRDDAPKKRETAGKWRRTGAPPVHSPPLSVQHIQDMRVATVTHVSWSIVTRWCAWVVVKYMHECRCSCTRSQQLEGVWTATQNPRKNLGILQKY